MISNTRAVLAAASVSSVVSPRLTVPSNSSNPNDSSRSHSTTYAGSFSLSSNDPTPASPFAAKPVQSRPPAPVPIPTSTHPQRASPGEPKAYPEPPALRTMNAVFPLGYRDAAYQWWTSISAPVAQQTVLSYIPYIQPASAAADSDATSTPDPWGPRTWRTAMVQLSGKNRALNELTVERVGEKVDDTLVILHGYGAGLGFFYKNFEPLSRAPGWRLHALDLLGMGNSTRPAFRIHAKDRQAQIREAEDWFVDALEEWRRLRNIERFTLLGHSLGGYLAVSYALKYPGRLNKLILASPVGIPEDPYAVNADMPEPGSSTLANEFTQDQEDIVKATTPPPPPPSDNNNFLNARTKSEAKAAAADQPQDPGSVKQPPKRPINKWFVWLWDANVSPFTLVRASGPIGPRLVSAWTSRRFSHLPEAESQALHDYTYSLFRQRGSGEYALPYLLAPGAYARSPIINRIHEVGRQPLPAAAGGGRETGLPVVMMYGEKDWMDVAGGFAAEEKLKARARQALLSGTPEERARENGSARVVITPRAGHHLYIDNHEDFNKVVMEEMQATKEQGVRERAAAAATATAASPAKPPSS